MSQHDSEIHFTPEFWDERYSSSDRLWSGQPNAQLVAHVADLPPGDALDVGCGEGADAIWLAGRGWHVTGIDISVVALERAARQAAEAGEEIAARITWQQRDLLTWAPGADQYDLVSAQFMHLPGAAQADMHRRLAVAVRPGGTLLVVGHHLDDVPEHDWRTGRPDMFRSAEEQVADLDPAAWEVVTATAIDRAATDTDGQPVTVSDSVLSARRRG